MSYEYYSGDGYEGLKESDSYFVKHGNGAGEGHEVWFNSLTKARAYYDKITGEDKALWKQKGLELIDCHTWKEDK